MSVKLKNKLTKTLFISLIISTVVSLLMVVGFLGTWQTKISDAFYFPSNTLDDIIIVAIDDDSLEELGLLPWPRSYYAKVVNQINQSSVIGIDIIFDLETNAENDSSLANSIKNANVDLYQDDAKTNDLTWLDAGWYYWTGGANTVPHGMYDVYVQHIQPLL